MKIPPFYIQLFFLCWASLFLSACDNDKQADVASQTSPKQTAVSYTPKDVVLEKYNWKGELPRRNQVKVINPYGNISSRNSSLQQIELAAVIQKVGPNAPKPEFKITDQGGVTVIEVIYQSSVIDEFTNRIGRVDLALFVPTGVSLQLETDFGDIKAKKHTSSMKVKSLSGKVSLMTSGQVEINTDSGDINLTLTEDQKPQWLKSSKQRPHKLQTQTGNINIYYSSSEKISLELKSGLAISTNDPALASEIQKSGQSFQLMSVLPQSSQIISAQSQTGSILFRDQQSEEEASNSVSNQTEPSEFNGNLQNLPEANSWKPGDPIIERDDKTSERSAKRQTDSDLQ